MDWDDEEEAILNEFYETEREQFLPPDEDDVPSDNGLSKINILPESNLQILENQPAVDYTKPMAQVSEVEQEIEIPDPWTIMNTKSKDLGHSMKKSFAFTALHASLEIVTKTAEQIQYCTESVDFLHTVPPTTGEYMSCTLADGSKHFLTKRAPVDESLMTAGDWDKRTNQLLQMSMPALTEKALELEVQSKLHKARAAELTVSDLAKSDQLLYENLTLEKSLWVEKYKPRGFSQLLSPENINREVLRALKQWDRFVFKRANPSMPEKPSYNKPTSAGSNTNTASTHKPKGPKQRGNMDGDDDNSGGEESVIDADDDDDPGRVRDLRPETKVLLLSGPPGTGKTTLAHILATHCGYRPFEINASVDRTSDVLREMIVSAMTANTVIGDKKPNCIILDEADGIDNTATIEMIVNMVKAPLHGDSRIASGAAGKKAKKGSPPASTTPLTRPIICICNDHFAPVLKSLKKVAQIFVFQPPSELRLVQRLKSICSSEGVDVHNSLLSDLCTASGNDIRSCLNSLQFAAMKALVGALEAQQLDEPVSKSTRKDITSTLMNMMKGGLNDRQKDVFSIWKEIFNKADFNKERVFKQKLVNESGSSSVFEGRGTEGIYETLTSMVSESGDGNLILNGVHENLPKARFSDPDMSRLLVSMEWLSFTDYVEQFARTSSGGYQVMTYASAYSVAVHTFCAQELRGNKLEWPFKDQTEYYKRQQRSNVLHSLVYNSSADLHSRSSVVTSKQVVCLDVLSSLVDILAPRLRAISSLSSPEKAALLRVVEVMASCGITFVSASSILGYNAPYRSFGQEQSDLVLEPNINELIQFTLAKSSTVPGLTKRNFPREERVNVVVHNTLHDDTKRAIQRELKTFLIHNKHGESEPASAATQQEVSNRTFTPKNSDSYYDKRDPGRDTVAETLRDVEEAEEERQIQLKAKRGRMDMFMTKPKVAKLFGDKDVSTTKVLVPANKNFGTTKASIVSVRPKLFFKFNQGFSNAVKRPVNISEFV